MKVTKKHPLVEMIKLNWEQAQTRFPKSKAFKGCVEYQHTGFYREDDFEMTLLDEDCFSTTGTLCLLGPFPDGGYSLEEEMEFGKEYAFVETQSAITNQDVGVLLAALRHLQDSITAGENLTKLQEIVDVDYLQSFDINELCESINTSVTPQKLSFLALNNGENPDGIVLEAEQLGDPGIYQEIGVSAYKGSECVAFAVVGLDPNNEVRVSLTTDGNGDGDQPLSIYPCRPIERCIESDG